MKIDYTPRLSRALRAYDRVYERIEDPSRQEERVAGVRWAIRLMELTGSEEIAVEWLEWVTQELRKSLDK